MGTLVGPEDRLLLLAAPEREEEAVMRLARVGYENVAGILDGGIDAWRSAGLPVSRVPQEPAESASRGERRVLDVRRSAEWSAFHLEDATHVPLSQLPKRLAELDRSEEWVVLCASGFRSSIATSVLERAGFTRIVNGVGGMDAYRAAGRPLAAG